MWSLWKIRSDKKERKITFYSLRRDSFAIWAMVLDEFED